MEISKYFSVYTPSLIDHSSIYQQQVIPQDNTFLIQSLRPRERHYPTELQYPQIQAQERNPFEDMFVEYFDQYYPASIQEDQEEEQAYQAPTKKGSPPPSIDKMINIGMQQIGKPYVSAGRNPKTGFDCSGYLWYIFNQAGIKIPLNIFQMAKAGREVSKEEAGKGDIIVKKGSGKSGLHVAVIIDKDSRTGKLTLLEAKGRKYGVVKSTLADTSGIRSYRRVWESTT